MILGEALTNQTSERGECDKEEGESEATKEQEKTRGGLTSNNEIEQKYADKKSSSALLQSLASLNRRRCNDLDRCRAADKQGSHFFPPGEGNVNEELSELVGTVVTHSK